MTKNAGPLSQFSSGGPEASCAIDHGDNYSEQYGHDSGEVRAHENRSN